MRRLRGHLQLEVTLALRAGSTGGIRLIQALLIPLPKRLHALLLSLLQHPLYRIQSPIQVLQRRPKAQPHIRMARRVEQIPPVRRVDIEEDTRNNNRLLLQQLLKEREPVVYWGWKFLEVEPDVEGCGGGDVDFKMHGFEAGEDVVAFHFEVFLESNFLLADVLGIEEGEGSKLERVVSAAIEEGARL